MVIVWSEGATAMRAAPVDAIATAGIAAQGWGLDVREERTRSIAQPRPNPSSVAPAVTPSVAPGRTSIVRRAAAAAPAAIDPRTVPVGGRTPGLVAFDRTRRWTSMLMDFSLSQWWVVALRSRVVGRADGHPGQMAGM
jgi:hypothetical protein